MIQITNLKAITFEETFTYGFKDKLKILENGKQISQFYFNMSGYNQDFYLFKSPIDRKERSDFGGEKGKTTAIREFKQAVKNGYVWLENFDEVTK